jgi:DegV family protein with EDD domain
MTIGIVTDSTCDLPPEIAAQHGIIIVPVYINLGNESYLDGVELSREAFYARLPECDPPPTTATPGPQMFLQAYERLAEEGATEILSVHVSRTLSAILDTAQAAAREAPVPVTVLDSGSLTLGTGFLAWAAAEAAARGASMDEIVALVKDQIQRTHVFAVLDTLDFLRRSGRLNAVVATLSSWLQIKALLKMHAGSASSEKIRTAQAATKRLVALLREQGPLERVALVHTHALEEARALEHSAQHLLSAQELLSVDITPVLGAHLGPGAVGFACVRAGEEGQTGSRNRAKRGERR